LHFQIRQTLMILLLGEFMEMWMLLFLASISVAVI